MKKLPFHSLTVGSAVKTVLIGSAAALPLMAASVPAFAQTNEQQIQQLQQQITDLQGKVANLQTQAAKAPKGAEASGFKVGNTTLKFGGYVKLDAIYDVNENLGYSANPSYISTGARSSVNQGHWLFQARQTRLTFDSATHTSMGTVKGHVEGDFWTGTGNRLASNSYTFRLRQAYLTWNHWLFGQAWTTFEDFHYGTTLDFFGPMGEIFMRQAQIRYTFDLAPGSNLAVALEDPYLSWRDSTGGWNRAPYPSFKGGTPDPSQSNIPDVVVRYQYNKGPLSFQVAGLARELKLKNVTGVTGSNSAFGWGLDIGGSYSLPTGTTLMATFTGGDGVGRYLYAPFVGGAYINNSGDVKALGKWGGTATISQKLAPKWTANLVYGFAKVQSLKNVTAYAGNLTNIANLYENVHANLLYRPVKSLMFGVGYIYTYASYQDGSQGDANRIQFSAQYSF